MWGFTTTSVRLLSKLWRKTITYKKRRIHIRLYYQSKKPFDQVIRMYFLNSLALFSGGIIALLVAIVKFRPNIGIFFIGWLSWACALAIKLVLLTFLWDISPFLANPDTLPYFLTITIVELIEVIAVYLFLKKHERIRNLNLYGYLTFALGFAVGEAFTLAIAGLLPIDVTPSLSFLLMMLERLSFVVIQFGWVTLIAYYVATKYELNLSLGVLFKIVATLLSLILPTIFFLYEFSFDISLMLFIGILSAYALLVLFIAWRFRSQIQNEGSSSIPFDLTYTLASIIAFVGLTLFIDMSLPFLYLNQTIEGVTKILFFIISTIILLEIFRWAAKNVVLSEIALGSFLGMLIIHMFWMSYAKESAISTLSVQAILLSPSLIFLTVLIGMALWKFARK
jgi:hypothetical protein